MSKTSIGLLAALAIATAVLLWFRLGDADDLALSAYPDRQFAVTDPGVIERIFIADMQGRSIDLRRRGGRWLIGDSLTASPSIMREVLNVLAKVEVDYIPPAATVATIEDALRTNALKIAVYDDDGVQLRSLLLGPSTQDERNSYMLIEGQRQPYAVRVPGHTGSLRPLFDLRSVDAWRSLGFVSVDPAEVAAVRVEYPRQRGASFSVERTSAGRTVRPLDPLVAPASSAANARLLESYVEGFADVPLVRRADDWSGADSVRALEPFAQITLRLDDGDATELKLHPVYLRDGAGNPRVDEPIPSYYVDRDGEELALVQTMQLQPWLRDYQSFFE